MFVRVHAPHAEAGAEGADVAGGLSVVGGGELNGGERQVKATETNRVEAATVLQSELEVIDAARRQLAHLYAFAPSHSDVEHELGECIAQIRKTVKRMREAWGELSQLTLPGA